ncbi:hypothetical protein DPMN_021408, partial [Dreissena polymorpha]
MRDDIIGLMGLSDDKISCENKRAYAPHVTLFKVPESAALNPRGSLNLRDFSNSYFGHQPVDNLQLCQIGEPLHGIYKNIWVTVHNKREKSSKASVRKSLKYHIL